MDPELIDRLDRLLYYPSLLFGGGPQLYGYLLNLGTEREARERAYRLLAHPDKVEVVSPWNINIDLLSDQINLCYSQTGYKVFDWRHRLLYVVRYGDRFGDDPLDKTLVLGSRTGDLFFLQFRTFNGYRTIALLINNITLSTSPAVKESELLDAPEAGLPPRLKEDNLISINCPLDDYKIHLLRLPPRGQPDLDELFLSVEDEVYTDLILYRPSDSGYFAVSKDEEFLEITDITGGGVDRFLPALGKRIYYLSTDRALDTVLLRHGLGNTDRRPPQVSREGAIEIEAKIL